ncbi:hypothetical protein OHC33_007415 [Knufia fluminis]|uniref:Uncharacterized protein n=1 Tax=Knufia fluminis TaxID=191047 RepID=A0AAN8EBD7_9EURO|nr:hypothetical protein OHC33_007415 [Knufia fluminis]
MHGARVSTTVSAASDIVKASSLHSDLFYKVPISRLLQIERHRGFEHEEHSHGLRRHQQSQSFDHITVCPLHSRFANTKYALTPPSTPVTVFRRSFSAQTCRQRSPPATSPRQPPRPNPRPLPPRAPPPQRGPLSPVYGRPAPEPSYTDADFANIVATSEDYERKKQADRRANLEYERAYDQLLFGIQHAQKKLVQYGFDEYPTVSVRQLVLDALHETRINYLAQVGRFLDNFRASADRQLKLAVLTGRRDYKLYCLQQQRSRVEHKLARIEKQIVDVYKPMVATLQRALGQIDQKFSELSFSHKEAKFVTKWMEWRAHQLEVQRNRVSASLLNLKAVGADLYTSQTLIDQVIDPAMALARLIRSLIALDPTSRYPKRLFDLRRRVAYLLPCFVAMGGLIAQGHEWRRLHRKHHISFRLPEAVDHEALYELLKTGLDWSQSNGRRMVELAAHVREWSKIGRGKAAAFEHKLDSVVRMLKEHIIGLNELGQGIDELMPDGFVLSSSAMEHKVGLAKYAILAPFYSYAQARSSTEVLLMNGLKNKYSGGMDPNSTLRDRNKGVISFGSPSFTQFVDWVAATISVQRSLTRDFYRLVNQLIIDVVTISLQRPKATYEAAWMTTKNDELAQQHETRQALANIVKHARQAGLEPTTDTPVFEPLRLLGALDLYSRSNVPVNYLISDPHASRVLEGLEQCPLLGMQAFISRGLQYMLLATTAEVFIFEGEHFQHGPRNGSFFKRLLEDANIVKVTHDLPTLNEHFAKSGVIPRSVFDIKSRNPPRSVRRSDRAKDGPPLYSLPRTWVTISNKSMLEVMCHLAFIPAYNLITFLNAMDISTMKNFPTHLQQSIRQSQEHLRAQAGEPISFGPLIWDREATAQSRLWPKSFTALHAKVEAGRPTMVEFVQAIARDFTRKLSLQSKHSIKLSPQELNSEALRTQLAAYYLYTSFGVDLPAIRNLLSIENPAKAILRVSTQLRMRLYDDHRSRLREAASQMDKSLVDRVKQFTWNKVSNMARSLTGTKKSKSTTETSTGETNIAAESFQDPYLRENEIRTPWTLRKIESGAGTRSLEVEDVTRFPLGDHEIRPITTEGRAVSKKQTQPLEVGFSDAPVQHAYMDEDDYRPTWFRDIEAEDMVSLATEAPSQIPRPRDGRLKLARQQKVQSTIEAKAKAKAEAKLEKAALRKQKQPVNGRDLSRGSAGNSDAILTERRHELQSTSSPAQARKKKPAIEYESRQNIDHGAVLAEEHQNYEAYLAAEEEARRTYERTVANARARHLKRDTRLPDDLAPPVNVHSTSKPEVNNAVPSLTQSTKPQRKRKAAVNASKPSPSTSMQLPSSDLAPLEPSQTETETMHSTENAHDEFSNPFFSNVVTVAEPGRSSMATQNHHQPDPIAGLSALAKGESVVPSSAPGNTESAKSTTNKSAIKGDETEQSSDPSPSRRTKTRRVRALQGNTSRVIRYKTAMSERPILRKPYASKGGLPDFIRDTVAARRTEAASKASTG